MYDNEDMLFDVPAKKGSNENVINISTVGQKASEDNRLYPYLERAKIAIRSLNAGTWTLDMATNSLMVCERCNEIIPIADLKNICIRSLYDLIIAGYKKRVVEDFLLGMQKSSSFDLEVPVDALRGSCPKWLRIAGVAVCGNKNSAQVIHGVVEDISERKNSELLKQDFLAMASHDLRSPLSAIKLYVQLCGRLAVNVGSDCISEMLEKASVQIDKMNRLIQCYLESSAITEGKLNLFSIPFDIKDLLCEVIGDQYLLNPGHIIFLKPGRCTRVCGDRDKIAQVVQNLLNNAIKYSSPSDVITVQFDTLGDFLQVVVEDHGIGIKAADQERVFDRFYRVEEDNQKTVKGYGIGLYLSKEIIKKHHGDIWIESEVDKGSRFYFTLPLS